jgi:hypothetical protein
LDGGAGLSAVHAPKVLSQHLDAAVHTTIVGGTIGEEQAGKQRWQA